jgi:hypothetical protein
MVWEAGKSKSMKLASGKGLLATPSHGERQKLREMCKNTIEQERVDNKPTPNN